jgi:hypothetical protein
MALTLAVSVVQVAKRADHNERMRVMRYNESKTEDLPSAAPMRPRRNRRVDIRNARREAVTVRSTRARREVTR